MNAVAPVDPVVSADEHKKSHAELAGVIEGEQQQRVPLSAIHSAINPEVYRNPTPGLHDAGKCPVNADGKPTPLALIHELALGEDDEKARYVALMDEYENGGVDSLVELADSPLGLRSKQLQAVVLVPYRCKIHGEYKQRYRIVAGERRILAMAYLYAKYGDKKYSYINAVIIRANKDKARQWSMAENFLRLDPSPSERAHTYLALKGDEGMSIADIASMFFGNNPRKTKSAAYQHVRNHLKLVSGQNKLSPERLAKLDRGEIGLTKAIKEAQGRGQANDRNENRRRTRGVKETEQAIDDILTAEGDLNDFQRGYLQACADSLGMTLEDAVQAAQERMEAEAEV